MFFNRQEELLRTKSLSMIIAHWKGTGKSEVTKTTVPGRKQTLWSLVPFKRNMKELPDQLTPTHTVKSPDLPVGIIIQIKAML